MSYLALSLYCMNRLVSAVARESTPVPAPVPAVVPGNGAGTVPSERFKPLVKSPGKSFLRSGGLRRAVALTLGLPVLLSTVAISPATAAPAQGSTVAGIAQKNLDPASYPDGRYIVVLAEKPAATYEGGTAGLPRHEAC